MIKLVIKKPGEESKKTYTHHYHCDNCGERFEAEFDFGEVAHQPTCPNCGVHPSQLTYI